MYQNLKVKNIPADKFWSSLDDAKNPKRKSDEGEFKKIEALCKEFGVPDPNELFIVPRDFNNMGNPNLTQFDPTMPDGLEKWVNESEFEYTISQINSFLAQAEKIGCRAVLNGICKYLTCFIIRGFQRSRMERAIIQTRNFILAQNQDVYHAKGLHIVEPGVRGMRHIEFRSITYYSMKYFLEHEDEIAVTESDANLHKAQEDKESISHLPPHRTQATNFHQLHSQQKPKYGGKNMDL